MSSGSNQTNEIQDMRNSMKINFINHLRASKKQQVPQTLNLYTQMKSEFKTPPPFSFKLKDKTLDWGKISQLNKQDLKVENMDEINSCVNNMTYGKLEKEDIQKMGCPRTIQAFKLFQLSIEYSSKLQSALDDILMDYEAEYYCINKAIEKSHRQCEINKNIISSNKDVIHKKKYTLHDYELLLRDLGFIEDDISTYSQLERLINKEFTFRSLYDLDQHYKKQHPKVQIDLEKYAVKKLHGASEPEPKAGMFGKPTEEQKEPRQSKRYREQKSIKKEDPKFKETEADFAKSVKSQRDKFDKISEMLDKPVPNKSEELNVPSDGISEVELQKLKEHFDNKFDGYERSMKDKVKETYNGIHEAVKQKK